MKKRNFWMRCLAFMLIVVMVLGEQHITTLGETISTYAQERMTDSSEQTEGTTMSQEASSQEEDTSGSSSQKAATTEAVSPETGTTASATTSKEGTSAANEETDASRQQDDKTTGEKGEETDSAKSQNKNSVSQQEKQTDEEQDDAKKTRRVEKRIAEQVEETNGMTYLQAAEQYYGDPETGDGGTMETATLSITKRGNQNQTDVKAGGTVSYEVSYQLFSAAYFDYGEQSRPLFDTYNDTKIVLHLPDGLIIDKDAEGTLQNVVSITEPQKGAPNDWILELNNRIQADSDKSGTFLVNLKVDGNGRLDVGHDFNFGEGNALAEIQTSFTIMDRTGTTDKPAEGIEPYTKTIGTTSTLNDLEAVTDDEWMIEKEANGFTPNADGTVTVKYNLSIGLKGTTVEGDNTKDSIIIDPGTYGREGRAAFTDKVTYESTDGTEVSYPAVKLTETLTVTGKDGNPMNAQSITVTPSFDNLAPITVTNGSILVPLDTCEGQTTGTTVDKDAPYLSNYTVEVVYENYEDNFVAHYYDSKEEQQKLDVVNEADIEYQFYGETNKRTDESEATQPVGDVTKPAAINLSKYIVDYKTNTSKVYSWENFANDPVSGAVTYKIQTSDEKVPNLYQLDEETGIYTKIESSDGIITFDPAQKQNQENASGLVTVYLDPGTYIITETDMPDNTETISASENDEDKNSDPKTITVAAEQTKGAVFYNKEQLGEITIHKSGQQNGVNSPLAGATFGIYTDSACTTPYEPYKDGVKTVANGTATFARLPYGTYYVKETEAPTGYIKDTETYTFTIPTDNKVVLEDDSINKYNRAPVELRKQMYNPNETGDNKYVNVTAAEAGNFANCFEVQKLNKDGTWTLLTASELGVSEDAYPLSLNQTGKISLSLPVYKDNGTTVITYRFRETLPDGWHADSEDTTEEAGKRFAYSEPFTLTEKIGNSDADPYTVTMKNDRNGSIELTKEFYSATASGMTKNTSADLSASFDLYYKNGPDGKLVKYNEEGSYTVTAAKSLTISDLPRTETINDVTYDRYYYLVESATEDGYAPSGTADLSGINTAERTSLPVGENGTNVEAYGPFNFAEVLSQDKGGTGRIELAQSVTITNVEQKVPIVVEKEDSYKDTYVSGAKYKIYKYDGDNADDGYKGELVTTSSDQNYQGEDIPSNGALTTLTPGQKYVIEESFAPAKYTFDSITIGTQTSTTTTAVIDLTDTNKVDTNTKPVNVVIKNKPDPTFTVTKIKDNAVGDDEELKGVEFEVYTKDDLDTFRRFQGYDGQDLTIESGTATSIPAGTYYLKEVADSKNGVLDPSEYASEYGTVGEYVPDGETKGFYFGPYKIEHEENKQAQIEETITNYSDKGAVEVTKYYETTSGMESPLANATLTIYKVVDGAEKKIKDVNSGTNGKALFADLPIYDEGGLITYRIRETAAPNGYTISDEYLDVTLKPGETVTTQKVNNEDVELKIVNQPETTLYVNKTYHNIWENKFTDKSYFLPGTVIALYKYNTGTNVYDLQDTETTDEMGDAIFRGLTQKDKYIAIEVCVPAGEEYKYLEPADRKSYLNADYLQDGYLPPTLTNQQLIEGNYSYVTKEVNPGNPILVYQGDSYNLLNEEHWAQLHIHKFVTDKKDGEPDKKRDINNAEFTLYMQVVDLKGQDPKDVSNPISLGYDSSHPEYYTKIGSYSSGTLYDTEGNRMNGWFGTDILKSADNVVYWLVETDAGIGASINPENVVTLIHRNGTYYKNDTKNYSYVENGETKPCPEGQPNATMTYMDDQVTEEDFENIPEYGPGYAQFSTVRIAKWQGAMDESGQRKEEFSPLGNAKFEIWLTNEEGQEYELLDTVTTGLDNNFGADASTDTDSDGDTNNNPNANPISGWASSKAFVWSQMEQLRANYPDAFVDDEKGNHYVRIAIKETTPPTGFMTEKQTVYMYMFFQNSTNETTEVFNDAYYVKTAENIVNLAEEQNGIQWAFYPTMKDGDEYKVVDSDKFGTGAPVSSTSQFRLVNWPIDTYAVTLQKYGYEVKNDNLGKTSKELDTYYTSGQTDRKPLSVTMKLERYNNEEKEWRPYTLDGDTNGRFQTGRDGSYIFRNGLPVGHYRITEETPDPAYENIYDGSTIERAAGEKNAKAYYFQVVDDNLNLTIYNPKKQSLTIKKTDMDDNPLSGTTFTLTEEDGTEITSTNKGEEDPTQVLSNIGSGTYVLSETPGTRYTNSYFASYFAAQYGKISGTAGSINQLVNEVEINNETKKGIFLGYTTTLEEDGNEANVVVNSKTDIYDYGISESNDGIDLNIKNPKTVAFDIKKQDAQDNTALPGAVFEVKYLAFNNDAINNDAIYNTLAEAAGATIAVNSSDFANVTATTYTTGEGGIAAVTGNPGIYQIKETTAPSDYDLTETAPKYVAMTGGLNIKSVTVDGTGIPVDRSTVEETQKSDNDVTIEFRDKKKVSLTIIKMIRNKEDGAEGQLAVSGNPEFTFNLYEDNQKQKLAGTAEIQWSVDGENKDTITGLSQGKTYYLEEISGENYEVSALKLNNNSIQDNGGLYTITIPDNSSAEVTVTAENTYLRGKISVRKVDGSTGNVLHGAEFEVFRLDTEKSEQGETKVTETPMPNIALAEEGSTGVYSAEVPLRSEAGETFRIREKEAPTNYLQDTESYIDITVEPRQIMEAPDLHNVDGTWPYASGDRDENNKNMLANQNFPNYNGAWIDITKYDDIYAAQPSATLGGAVFTLYEYNANTETWSSAGSQTTSTENGALRFVVRGGTQYAIEETSAPLGYKGLDSIYQRNTETGADEAVATIKAKMTNGEEKTLYQINNGAAVTAGVSYAYDAYNIPYQSLRIEKENALDPTTRLTAQADVYELPDNVSLNSDEDVLKYLQGTLTGTEEEPKVPTPVIPDVEVNTNGSDGTDHLYTYADGISDPRLNGAIVAGKSYLVVEKTASVSQIRDNDDVEWYGIVDVPENSNKNGSYIVTLKNIEGAATLSLSKTATPDKFESLFTTESTTVHYTITPTVNNTLPLDTFVVNDTGLTAYNGNTQLTDTDTLTYLKNGYSLTEVTIGKATHETKGYAVESDGAVDKITAEVTFYDFDGNPIGEPEILDVSNTDAKAIPDSGKAARVSVKYYSTDFKEAAGYDLGTNFKPGDIDITAVIDQQSGGNGKKEIDRIRNTAQTVMKYYPWDVSGNKAGQPTTEEKSAYADVEFEAQKGAKISVTKDIVSTQEGQEIKTVNLQDTITYEVEISNAADSGAALKNPYIVDYLPQGSSWVEFDSVNPVQLVDEDNTGLTVVDAPRETKDGENAVFVYLNGNLEPGKSVKVQLKVKVENTVTSYGTTMYNYAFVGSTEKGAQTDKNPQEASFMTSSGDWAPTIDSILNGWQMSEPRKNALNTMLEAQQLNGGGYVSGSRTVNWAGDSDVVLVKSAYGDANSEDGYSTDILLEVSNGGTMHYRLTVSNTSMLNGVTKFSVIDILPNVGDMTSGNSSRGSAWALNFGKIDNIYIGQTTEDENTGTVTTPDPVLSDHYRVYYYTGDLNTAGYMNLYNQVESIDFDTPPAAESGWVTSIDQNNIGQVKAFVVVTDDTVRLNNNENLIIEYTARVNNGTEWNDEILSNNSWQNAVNSFSCSYSRYDLSSPSSALVKAGIIMGSNQVSATIMPKSVSVGGQLWIDKDGDGVREEGESLVEQKDTNGEGQSETVNNFEGNYLVGQLLKNFNIRLDTYSGTKTTSDGRTPYNKGDTWHGTYLFSDLNPAMLKTGITDEAAYPNQNSGLFPGGEIDPSKLKGSAPNTYELIADLGGVDGFEVTSVGKTSGKSRDPENPDSFHPEGGDETTDNNFVVDGSITRSERFYLWATDSDYDMTKDIGVVLKRNLVITKQAEDTKEPIEGVIFKVYGPFDEDETITVDKLKNAKQQYTDMTDAQGKATFSNLLWYKKYVIVEERVPEGYELDGAFAKKTEDDNKAKLSELTLITNDEILKGKPAWILGVPDDRAQDATDEVTVTNKRTATETSLTASKTFTKLGVEQSLTADQFKFSLWKEYPGEGKLPIKTKGIDVNGNVTFAASDFDDTAKELTFTSEGTYTYYITEELPTEAQGANPYEGIKYDEAIYRATVNVKWTDGKGLGVESVTYEKKVGDAWATVGSGETPTFTNEYTATGFWTPEGTKTLTGRTMKAGEKYTFYVKDKTGKVISTGTATGQEGQQSAEIVFNNKIEYDLNDVGKIYTYTIKEDKAGQKVSGVIYDDKIYTVTVTVTDNGKGTLVPHATYKVGDTTANQADFTNIYEPTPITYTPYVSKTLTGHELPVNTENKREKTFTFSLSKGSCNPEDGVQMPSTETLEIPITKESSADVSDVKSFGAITFTKAGTYTFTINEEKTDEVGVTYDETVWTVTVKVTDDKEGKLTKTVTYTNNKSQQAVTITGDTIPFTNSYQPTQIAVPLSVSKAVEGADMPKSQTFTFKLSMNGQNDGSVSIPQEGITKEVTVSQTGEASREKVTFDPITFTKAGTYTFKIEETAILPDGYTMPTPTRYVQVVVSDNNGRLQSSVAYYLSDPAVVDGDNTASRFTNNYRTVDADFAPKVIKTLNGDIPAGTKEFQFKIENISGDQTGFSITNANCVVGYAQTTGDKEAYFEPITFTKAGEYKFRIEEIPTDADGNKGYAYDDSKWILTVNVVDDPDDNDNHLKATGTYVKENGSGSNNNAASFTNSYDVTPDTYAPKVKKIITGADIPAGRKDKFDFTLTYKDADSAYAGEDVTGSVKYGSDVMSVNDVKNLTMTGSGENSFEELTFTKAGTYTFEISETKGNQPGYQYDDSTWTLTVTVVDENGVLKATPSYTKTGDKSDTQASFTNTYSVTPVDFIPKVEKQFSDDSVTRPTAKDFKFTLTADVKNPSGGAFTGVTGVEEGTELTGENNTPTATVNGAGTVNFSTITFKRAGTYTFRITEKEGEDLGYTYDDSVWTLTVQVNDIGGALQVTDNDVTYESDDTAVEPNNENAVFVNEYHYVASIVINKEVLRGDAAYETDDVFYAGIFRKVDSTDNGSGGQDGDAQEGSGTTGSTYELVKNVIVDDKTVENGVVQLVNNSSVEVYVPLGGEEQTEAVTYYVFETDADGHPLVSFDAEGNAVYNQPFTYEISSQSTGEDGTVNDRGEVYVTAEAAGAHPEVTITNKATSVSIEKRDTSGNPLSGAVLELWKQADSVDAGVEADADRTKADNGDILLETWTSDGTPHELTAELAVGGTYYLHETQVPEGYLQAADILFTVENGEPITLVMEDKDQAGMLGQIQVTKRLSTIDETTFDNIDLVAADATYYVGLFTDAEGKHPYGSDYVKEIHIQNASSGTVTYDNLPSGTYYVFETQQDGTVIPYGELQTINAESGEGFVCVGDGAEGGAKEITLQLDAGTAAGSTELENVYYGTLPEGFAYQGQIMLTKAIVKDGAPADSDDTFYAGIFTSETETAPYKVVTLENNGTVTVEVPLGGENGMDPVTYYIYETDANGNKVDKDSFAYTVSGEGTVALDMNSTVGTRTIINTIASSSETTRTIRETSDKDNISSKTDKGSTATNRRTSSSKTGDDTRTGLYILFFAAAVVGIVITLRKRKEDISE